MTNNLDGHTYIDEAIINDASAFNEALIIKLKSNFNNLHTDNWDFDRFGAEPDYSEHFERTLEQSLAIVPDFKRIGFLYNLLEDDLSKNILVSLFAYRILGYKKVRLPRNNDFYQMAMSKIHALPKLQSLNIPAGVGGFDLTLFDLRAVNFELTMFASLLGVNLTFLQKQYELHHGDIHIKAEIGDTVIDAGGCWGDTALYFAHEVGGGADESYPLNLSLVIWMF